MFAKLRRRWRYRKTWGSPVGRDCISLDISLAAWLAPRLRFLAEHCHGCPGGYVPDYWTDWYDAEFEAGFAKWQAELRHHAEALARYAKHFDLDDMDAEEQALAEGRAAMVWVAVNLTSLWD